MKSIGIIILWFIIVLTFISVSVNYLYIHSRESIIYNSKASLINYILEKPQNKPDISPDKDIRVLALKKFLHDQKSPLESDAETLIYVADIYGIDYALIPAIAMQESQGCKRIPEGSYNCWGFGIYGNNKIYFNSYKEAVEKIAKTIKESYIKNGYTNATLVEDIWAPPSKGQWSFSVNFFIGKIKDYERTLAGT